MSTSKRKRARREHGPPRLPMWKVSLTAHRIEPHWSIPATQITVGAATSESACSMVVRMAHIDAGVAPLRSLLALSLAYATAVPARSPAVRSEAA